MVLTHDPTLSSEVRRTIAIRDGRTSTETLTRRRRMSSGRHEVVREELAVLDNAGRLQLPARYVETLALRRGVRLELEPDHIGVWPDDQQESHP